MDSIQPLAAAKEQSHIDHSALSPSITIPQPDLLMSRAVFGCSRFIHSFILNIYIAPLQENYSEALQFAFNLKTFMLFHIERKHL